MTGDVEFFFNHASIESRLYVLPTDDDGELKSTEGTDSFSLASAKDGFSANKLTKLAHTYAEALVQEYCCIPW